ncbi:FUN14 family-domain-containing protein [Russula ochroleuca]|uniref:FUN14 family-domain-containing protein n=1 Tax=Russula ochroleuca TaxID=152965 RepID=A0A9P5MTV1_9AGAM|nr:FUN14 family-domain-containing protein [Russula ochroleuca]
MSSLYAHVFSHQAALRRTSFQLGLKHATHALRRTTIASPLRARPFSSNVTPNRAVARVGTGLAGAGLGLLFYANFQKLNCEPLGPSNLAPLPPDPQSTVNMYELTFGTVCGVCAGVFVKKGAKTLAFVFGGIFVLLQYLGSVSIIRIDWSRAAAGFEGLFYTLETNGTRRPPTVYSLWRRLIDFLTADFQPRASFIAGFALGMRIG